MVIDTSAFVAVLLREQGYQSLVAKIVDSSRNFISAVSYMEASMVLLGRRGEMSVEEFRHLLVESDCKIVPVDAEQAKLAVRGFRQFGKGRHPAGLNFGDCFSYALASSISEPLLFKGSDFAKTDLRPA